MFKSLTLVILPIFSRTRVLYKCVCLCVCGWAGEFLGLANVHLLLVIVVDFLGDRARGSIYGQLVEAHL